MNAVRAAWQYTFFFWALSCAEPYQSSQVGPDATPDGAVVPLDSGQRLDGGSTPDAAINGGAGYCVGWTYCDEFEGGGTIPWETEPQGKLARTELSTMRAVSGTHSLRGYRTGPTTEYASWVFSPRGVTQCEYDAFVPTPGGTLKPNIQISYIFMFGVAGAATPPYPASIFFTSMGEIRSAAYVKLGPPTGEYSVIETSRFRQQPIYDTWLRLRYELVGTGLGTTSSSVFSVTSAGNAAESQTLSYPEIRYTSAILRFGVADTVGAASAEVFIDNVRCK
jgi:hypothetical protein